MYDGSMFIIKSINIYENEGLSVKREEVFKNMMETLYESSRLIHLYESVPRKYGTDDELYMVEVHTLDLIGRHGKITTTEIAEINNRTTSAASQMVEKLIKKELVHKYRNPNNFRELLIELTEKGEIVYEYHKNLDDVEYNIHLERLEEYSTEDFEKLMQIVKMINEGVEKALP